MTPSTGPVVVASPPWARSKSWRLIWLSRGARCAGLSHRALSAPTESAGSRLIGLLPYRRPYAEQVFEAFVADGGLTEDQAALLNEVYVLEVALSTPPRMSMKEVRDAIERLRKALPRLIESTHVWLRRHGVEFG